MSLQTILNEITSLETLYKSSRDSFSEDFRLRIHRSLSWIKKARLFAQETPADLDMTFINLWIGFNAAYAKNLNTNISADKISFQEFLQLICSLDSEQKLYKLVWSSFSKSIRLLLDNRFVFQPFWDYHNGLITEEEWTSSFAKAKQKAHQALAAQDTGALLMVLFDRLYTLRNQIMHGGATYASSANRDQLNDACYFLASCTIIILEIMMRNPSEQHWGKPFYPYLKEN